MVGTFNFHSSTRRSSLSPCSCLKHRTSNHAYSALRFNISIQIRSRLASFGIGTGHSHLLMGVHTSTRSLLFTQACDIPRGYFQATQYGPTWLAYRSQTHREEISLSTILSLTRTLCRFSWSFSLAVCNLCSMVAYIWKGVSISIAPLLLARTEETG